MPAISAEPVRLLNHAYPLPYRLNVEREETKTPHPT
jgi:hypothetical protein